MLIDLDDARYQKIISQIEPRWQTETLTSKRIDRQRASDAVANAYQFMACEVPPLYFVHEPKDAVGFLADELNAGEEMLFWADPEVWQKSIMLEMPDWKIWEELDRLIYRRESAIVAALYLGRSELLKRQIRTEFFSLVDHCIKPELWAVLACQIQFWISTDMAKHNSSAWNIFQSLVGSCGWVFPYANKAVICDRPRWLTLQCARLAAAAASKLLKS